MMASSGARERHTRARAMGDRARMDPERDARVDAGAGTRGATREGRTYDVVIYGASGFTGALAVRYARAGRERGGATRVALAGRNSARVRAVAAREGGGMFDVVDASTAAAREAMCASASCVLSFAGPFDADDETPLRLAEACARNGTDYCDITGEARFARRVAEACHETCVANGCVSVSCCGYDSVPWDLGASQAAAAVRASVRGATCTLASGHAGRARGGVSGGTIASAANLLSKPKKETRGMGNPHYLANAPGGWPARPDVEALKRWPSPQSTYKYDEDTKSWTMPSIMAGINTKVVARSYSLDPERYGEKFVYDESDLCKSKRHAILGTAGLGLFGVAFVTAPLRWLMRKTILPKQGDGPSEELRENGYSHVYVVAKGEANGKPVEPWCAEFEFKNADPGYKGTAALAYEVALCFAIPSERARLNWPEGGGCLTPSVACGDVLVERLQKSENFNFRVKPLKDTIFLV